MNARPVTEHVFRISLRMVNVYLIVLPESLTLVDAGTRGSWTRVAGAVRELGRAPEEISDIVVTHLHGDHTGGLAEAKRATGARVWMHAADATLVREGRASRPWQGAPGSVIGVLAARFAGEGSATVEPVTADEEVADRQDLPVARVGPGRVGGLLAVWTPGHTEGHVAYLWPGDGGVLFVGDAAARFLRLRTGPLYEDYPGGIKSLRLLGTLDFQTACFSHGRPLVGGAAAAFAKKWPEKPAAQTGDAPAGGGTP